MSNKSPGWMVHKFGGTSVAGAERYQAVAEIIRATDASRRQAVVVSAMSGVTDALLSLIEAAKKQDPSLSAKTTELKNRHLHTARDLSAPPEVSAAIERDFQDLADLLQAIKLARSASREMQEMISGYGELWSALLLHSHFKSCGDSATWLDAREVLIVRDAEIGVAVDWERSTKLVGSWLDSHPERYVVITGFIASTPDGIPTTLRRNGSDFSATIFGSLLDAESVTIWKEVDGILSANPKLVPDAIVLDELTYEEASELAYFGAKVLHPSTMAPAIAKNIPILIRNSMDASKPGTRVQAVARSAYPVKGFTTIDEVALINVEGTGMIGVPGVAHRLFGALREIGVSVILISQASSEHSICFAVPEKDAVKAKESLERAFFAELQQKQIECVESIPGCSILAVVGDRMVEQKGVAANFFSNLSRAGVNIRAIAQGSSERNISVVIRREDSTKALRAAHSGFDLSRRRVSVGLIGPGLIGKALLAQLESQRSYLADKFNVELRLRAIADSKQMWLAQNSLPYLAPERGTGTPLDLDRLLDHVCEDHLPHSVLIDCTSSDRVAEAYPKWLLRGAHVVTPNKKAGSGSATLYRSIRQAERNQQRRFYYEATVGAGLPVITTLQDLIHTGDRIRSIEGVFSGTLSYVFNTFSEQRPFSSVILDAQSRGYTEPDPRDDLSGRDVARKLIILAREAGLDLELEQIPIESLVPASLSGTSIEEFLKNLPTGDFEMAQKLKAARQNGNVLRYVGKVELPSDGPPRCTVRLAEYPELHPFARISGTDNIIAFTTDRYSSQPLIVQGPGAGPAVTAGGIFADLLRLITALGEGR